MGLNMAQLKQTVFHTLNLDVTGPEDVFLGLMSQTFWMSGLMSTRNDSQSAEVISQTLGLT